MRICDERRKLLHRTDDPSEALQKRHPRQSAKRDKMVRVLIVQIKLEGVFRGEAPELTFASFCSGAKGCRSKSEISPIPDYSS